MTERSFNKRDTPDRNIGFLVNDLARLMRTDYDRRMRALGLSRGQWWLLTHLYFHDGCSQTELANSMEAERATVGRMLDRLEARGWVERRMDPSDRRLKRVFLTPTVAGLVRRMRAHAEELQARFMGGLSPGQCELFLELARHIKQNLLAQTEQDRYEPEFAQAGE